MFLIGEYRPRLRFVLLVANLALLALPVIGVLYLRSYETILVQTTESQLAQQGALVAVIYRSSLAFMTPEERAAFLEKYPRIVNGSSKRHEFFGTRPPTLNLRTSPIEGQPIWRRGSDVGDKNMLADPDSVAIGKTIEPYLRSLKEASLADVRVIDFNGFVVASTSDDPYSSISIQGNLSAVVDGTDARWLYRNDKVERHPLMKFISHEGTITVAVGFPIILDNHLIGAAMISKTPSTMFDAIEKNLNGLLAAGILLFVAVLLISIFTSLTITRPVRAVVDQTKRAIRGERGAVRPLRRTVTREVKELSRAISSMAMELEQRSDYIRDFASHVSHEFKTPLSSTLGAVELLRDHSSTMTPEDHRRFLSIIDSDTRRLQLLVERLLELAKAELVEVGRNDRTKVEEVLGNIQKRHGSRQIHVNVSRNVHRKEVAMAMETLDSILTSLIENAYEHGGDKVEVTITCGLASGRRRSMDIQVSNKGRTISDTNAKKIFDPFFTTSRDKGSSGLGLSVIKALVEAHQGVIELIPSDSGAIFRVVLPLR